MKDNKENYKSVANDARITVLGMIHRAGTSHIASNFSVIDLTTVLYEQVDLAKDRIIWSKGWAAATAYYFLARKGVIPKSDLDTYCQPNSAYIGLTEPTIKGIDFAGGSMGMGLPAGVGFALAKKMAKQPGKIYVIMSDGEQAIGTTWESMLIANHHNLSHLVVLIDNNVFQATGRVKEVVDIEPLEDKWKACGWNVQTIDGHNFGQIEKSLKSISDKKPNVIICNTIKGSGGQTACNIFENKLEWHYKSPTKEIYENAIKLLNQEKM